MQLKSAKDQRPYTCVYRSNATLSILASWEKYINDMSSESIIYLA